MDGKKQGAHQHQQVSLIHSQVPAGHAQQVQANHGQGNRSHNHRAALLLKEKSQDRDNDDIAGSDEARLSHSSVLDAELLEIAGKAQGHAAAHAALATSVFLAPWG